MDTYNIRTRKTKKPVAAHFCQPNHTMEGLEVMGIEKIFTGTANSGERKENTVSTLTQSG